jgi:hypothetical protein
MPTLTSTKTLDQSQVASRLRRLDAAFRTRTFTLMLLGVLFLFIGPGLFTLIAWNMQFMAQGYPTPPGEIFLICSAVLIPLLFILEYFTRGTFYSAPDAPDPDSMGGDSPASRGGAYALVIEISLWGPRIIMSGLRKLREESRFSNDARAAGAQIIACLLKTEEGSLYSGRLLTTCALEDDLFADSLRYLTFHDRVGIAKDGSRVWLISEARRKIEK